ncbi:MAG: MGMT family protein [bacterium]
MSLCLQNIKLTPFQKRVYKAVLSIPKGETRTYEWVAQRIGNPKAARAVGNALSKNPCPIIIPCHRIIRKNGKLGGYIRGKEEKMALLKKEEAPVAQYGRAAVS